MRLPISDKLHRISRSLQVIADYWPNLRFRQEGICL